MIDYTSLLPLEVWLSVIEILAEGTVDPNGEIARRGRMRRLTKNTPPIRELCLISRFFHHLAGPFRFRDVNFAIEDAIKDGEHNLSQIRGFLCLVEERPEVKMSVRVCQVGPWPSPEDILQAEGIREQYDAALASIERLVPELKSLHTLRCSLIPFAPTLYTGIMQLPRLRSFDVHLNGFPTEGLNSDLVLRTNAKPPICPIRELRISGLAEVTAETAFALLAVVHLPSLVHLQYLQRPRGEIPNDGLTLYRLIADHIPQHVNFVNLRSLTVKTPTSGSEVQWFTHLARRCPNLVELALCRNLAEASSTLAVELERQGFAEEIIPFLQSFSGPLAIARPFLFHRPVRSVKVYVYPFRRVPDINVAPASALAALKPSVPIQDLCVIVPRWNDDELEAISLHHSRVEILEYHACNGSYKGWTSRQELAFNRMTRLKRLTLRCGVDVASRGPDGTPSVIVDNDPIITKLRGLCPDLDAVNMEWRGRWKRRDEPNSAAT